MYSITRLSIIIQNAVGKLISYIISTSSAFKAKCADHQLSNMAHFLGKGISHTCNFSPRFRNDHTIIKVTIHYCYEYLTMKSQWKSAQQILYDAHRQFVHICSEEKYYVVKFHTCMISVVLSINGILNSVR